MKSVDRNTILSLLERLEAANSSSSWSEVEELFVGAVEPLLWADGYSVHRPPRSADGGFDLLAERPPSEEHEGQILGVEFKHNSSHRPLSLDRFASHLVQALVNDIDRVVIFSTGGFTRTARQKVGREFPVQVELLSPNAIRAWLDRLDVEPESLSAEAREILRVVSRKFATLVARDPKVLDELEWRDLERVMAEVFEGLGFSTTLTPSTQDGGKDAVLECEVRGDHAVYIVEIKHWRSGSRVRGESVRHFLDVIVGEGRDGGVFLSSYGYCNNAFEQLSAIDRQRVRFGGQDKIVALCRTYVKAGSGLWSPPENLAEVLYEGTD